MYMGICYLCGKETDLEYKCPFCNLAFCEDHRLPEQHNCINLPNRDWDTYRSESIRIGRLVPTKYKKERLLDGFGRYIMQPNGSSENEFEKNTDTSFVRKGTGIDKNIRKSNGPSENEFEKNTDTSFVRKGAGIEKNIRKYKTSKFYFVFRIIMMLLVVSTSLIVLHEFGYVNLYKLYGLIENWLSQMGINFKLPNI
jgi:hypothetical protein